MSYGEDEVGGDEETSAVGYVFGFDGVMFEGDGSDGIVRKRLEGISAYIFKGSLGSVRLIYVDISFV